MTTNFPGGLDSFNNPDSDDTLGTPGVLHSDQHANANDAIEAIESRLGIKGSTVADSIDRRLRGAPYVTISGAHPATPIYGFKDATPNYDGISVYEQDTGKFLIRKSGAYMPPWNLPWGYVTSGTKTNTQTGIGTSVTDLTGLSVTFNAVAGRRYKISCFTRFTIASDQVYAAVLIRDGSNTVLQEARMDASGSTSSVTLQPWVLVSGISGSVTYKISANAESSTIDFFGSATAPGTIFVEDIGPT